MDKKHSDMCNSDGVQNQAAASKMLLAVSFGTSFQDSLEKTIGAIEKDLDAAFPDYSLRRAFTSSVILRILKKRDGMEIDSVKAALERAKADHISEVVIQPTHMMGGLEYEKLMGMAQEYAGCFQKFSVGKPLLSDEEDFDDLIHAITSATEEYCDGETAVCFMGHGTEANSNAVYHRLQEKLTQKGFANYFIGTVEASPTVQDILAALPAEIRCVVLQPLMIVAGDHASKDMAGNDEGSWKSTFLSAGYRVKCILRGLGELEDVRRLFVRHAKNAQ